MKFYRVFRNGYEGIGEVFTSRADAQTDAVNRKAAFEDLMRERMARIQGGTFYDTTFVAFECDAEGNRAF